MNRKGASALKKLTGGDNMSAEAKRVNERTKIRGDFNIIITANTRLLVAIEGDKSAWRRRLLLIPFEREPVTKPIAEFGRNLVEEEGEGIFAWMVRGAQLLLRDLKEIGKIRLDAIQRQRVLDLLAESDSVMAFVTRRICRDPEGRVRTRDLCDHYQDFCLNNGFVPLPRKTFERRLASEMMEAHGATSSENVIVFGERARGYIGVRVLGYSAPDVEPASGEQQQHG